MKRRSRSYKGSADTVSHIAQLRSNPKLCFCDASPEFDKSGFILVRGFLAAWSLEDMSFIVECVLFEREEGDRLGKSCAVSLLEMLAVQLASRHYPDHSIATDSLVAAIACKKLGIACAEWTPRELNSIANKLAKGKQTGRGYIAFNSTKVERNWVDFVYEKIE